MKYRNLVIGLGIVVAGGIGVLAAGELERPAPAIIPLPQKVESRSGQFTLGTDASILAGPGAKGTAEYLAETLRKSTGYKLKVETLARNSAVKGDIVLTTNEAKASLGDEGYELTVAPESVLIRAATRAGLFYGVQSLLQLFPPAIFGSQPASKQEWTADCVQIEDQPRFKWRGFMLDVSRHFFNKEEVERVLDTMALHKLNIFHWHLVDDQGWRIEIKKYPRLTEVGGWRKGIGFRLDPKSTTAYGPDGRYGGFYTQAEIREVVAYAQARHITVVPEIEMPGHSCAALTAYPELGCTGGPYTLDVDGGVFEGIYCAGKDETFEFMQNVLVEVMDLFPGKFIHIGGDEVPKSPWRKCARCQARMKAEGLRTEQELQSYFIGRVEKFINANGRRLLGWTEIAEGGLAPNAAVMDWKGGAVEAAGAGHDVVMSPTGFCYFDYYQSTNRSAEPRANGSPLLLRKVYAFEPIPARLDGQLQRHIMGGQGNLWTEYVPSLKHAEYMMFPRLCGLSEVVWSATGGRDFNDFTRRLKVQCQRFDQLGVNYRRLD